VDPDICLGAVVYNTAEWNRWRLAEIPADSEKFSGGR
jgi:hypothetical protein